MNSAGKIVSLDAISALSTDLKKQGKKIVTTNGAFDLLHIGHTRSLEQSKSWGDVLIVGINSDASVKQYKSLERPIIPEAERAEMVAALACVDYVVIFGDERPMRFLEAVQPHIHTKGGDYDMEELHETKLIRSFGGEIRRTNSVKSTTGIIERILAIYGRMPAEGKEGIR